MSGRLIVQNGECKLVKDGVTRLNADDRFLHGVSAGLPINGTIAIPAFNINGVRYNDTIVNDLGAVMHPNHTQVIGAFKFKLNNNAAGFAFDRWHMIMGGNALWLMDGEPGSLSTLGDNTNVGPLQWIDYSFRVSAGRVQMLRRRALQDTAINYTVLSHSIEYKLRTGNWT